MGATEGQHTSRKGTMGDGGKHRPFMPAKLSCFQPQWGSTRSMACGYTDFITSAASVATKRNMCCAPKFL